MYIYHLYSNSQYFNIDKGFLKLKIKGVTYLFALAGYGNPTSASATTYWFLIPMGADPLNDISKMIRISCKPIKTGQELVDWINNKPSGFAITQVAKTDISDPEYIESSRFLEVLADMNNLYPEIEIPDSIEEVYQYNNISHTLRIDYSKGASANIVNMSSYIGNVQFGNVESYTFGMSDTSESASISLSQYAASKIENMKEYIRNNTSFHSDPQFADATKIEYTDGSYDIVHEVLTEQQAKEYAYQNILNIYGSFYKANEVELANRYNLERAGD